MRTIVTTVYTFDELSDEAVSDFIDTVAGKLGKEWTNDNEYQMTDEYISEILTINDYEFTEDGDRI